MNTSKGIEQAEMIRLDAARYRWLRSQNWNDGQLAVVVDPKRSVKLGHDCPSLDRLDEMIDDQINRSQPPLVALHNAAQLYAAPLQPRDCSQYADETASWSEDQDYEIGMNMLRNLLATVAPQCKPMDTLSGLVSQIDNYIAGFIRSDKWTIEETKWHVVVDTSQQDEFGNGPQGIAITPHEDDVVDAIAWMQEGTYEDAVVMAKSRETAKALEEAVELLREQYERFLAKLGYLQPIDRREVHWTLKVGKFLEGK